MFENLECGERHEIKSSDVEKLLGCIQGGILYPFPSLSKQEGENVAKETFRSSQVATFYLKDGNVLVVAFK